jgi:hypothetical protein
VAWGASLVLVLAVLVHPGPASAWQGDGEIPSISEKTEGMEKMDGFIPMYWDAKAGKIWLEISRFDEEILHYSSLPAGIGSNDIGLDRGQLGSTHVITFHRVGPQVFMVQPNYRYRAESDNELERKAVDDAFARSILWGFRVAAESDGVVLVDATDFVLRDAHGVVNRLRQSNQGTYRLDKARSALFLDRTRGFPLNSEIEVTLTFAGERPGAWIRSVTPSPESVTVRQHHSFVQLPELGDYTPREHDPRSGYGAITYMDYATPLGQPMTKRYIRRHRLEKRNPSAERSEAVEPIIYYLDPGTPEPVASALIDGARWWNQAFEAAGFIDAFQVEMLPADADPMDLRYNVIQWIHRSTRGWSYGSSVTDPRTGEILKGHVSLGSLRVRQDWLIAEGLLAPYVNGDEEPAEVREMALARIRQLSAHEVGHTIGLSHNYISSAQGRASVMDYPHPLVQLDSRGDIDLSDAYDVDIGEWDKITVMYGYTDFGPGTDEDAALEQILQDGLAEGISFLADQDARPQGSAHSQTHLWDNGENAARELDRMMEVRRVALDRFGEQVIKTGMPMATMEEALVPLFLHHRYQVEGAVKVVGGLDYTYALRGDGQDPVTPLSEAQQREALTAVLGTLAPSQLTIPESVLDQLPPRPAGWGPHRELFNRHTGLVFDGVAPGTAAADVIVGLLLHPERSARLVQQKAHSEDQLGYSDVLHELMNATFRATPANGYEAELNRATERVVVDRIMWLAARAPMAQVRAESSYALSELAQWLVTESNGASTADRAHYFDLGSEIGRFFNRPMEAPAAPSTPAPPPGSPIGDPGMDWFGLSCSYGAETVWPIPF